MSNFETEIATVVESMIFMAVYEKRTVNIPSKQKPVVRKDNDSAMFILHSIAEIRCILVALNQLNKITDNPFESFNVELWKGNALEKILSYRLTNEDLEVLWKENEVVDLNDQYAACLLTVEYCVSNE